MPRTYSIPLNTYAAGAYGPFSVDGRKLGDNGFRLSVQRGAAGSWPLTPADPILTVDIEYLYGAVWSKAASVTFTGGTQTDRWSGGTKLYDYATVSWPLERIDGVLQPVPPDAARATFTVHAQANIGGSVEWI